MGKDYKDYYVYPAVFNYDDDGISIEFPDLPGCLPCASSQEEAIKNAKEALALHLYGIEQDKEDIPKSSFIKDIKIKKNQSVVLVEVSMPMYRLAVRNKSVNLNVTLPQWLKEEGVRNNINFSLLLQNALKQIFSGGGDSENYWIDKAEEMIKEVLKLIRIYNDGYVNFEELHKMSTDDDYRNSRISEIKVWLESEDESVRRLNDDQKYNFITAYKFFRDEFDKLDEKAQGYIKSEITRMTSPFISLSENDRLNE